MANWKRTVDVCNVIKQYKTDDPEDMDVAACAAAILELLEKRLPTYADEYGHHLQDIAEAEEYAEWEELQYELDQLYDYADRNLIWMGI